MLSFRRRERLPQVVLIETGLIFPQGDYSTKDLVIAREYRACFTLTDPRFRREVPDITNNNNRRDSRDRSILEHTDESGALVRPVLFSTTDVLQRLQVSCCLPSTVIAFVAYTIEKMYSSILPHSEREFPIRGLNLIRLLIQNRIADFHTTLESLPLPADELIANPFIRHPVNLERWLMEGSYSKVWNAREEAPAEEYKFFVDSLMGTIRFVFFNKNKNKKHNFFLSPFVIGSLAAHSTRQERDCEL